MKRIFTLLLALTCILTLAGCSDKTTHIDFPFAVRDVVNIEMYHYDGNPAFIEKKVVVSDDDIRALYEMFESLSLEPVTAEKPKGGLITSFRFNLPDETSYALIYCCYGVKNGTLKSSTENFEYFTYADIGSFWYTIEADTATVKESELPK